jgi:hypothetical protein
MSIEHPQCYTQANRRARKPHKCCECRGVIARGETYVYFSGVWDCMPATYKTCTDCATLRAEVDAGQPYDETTPFERLSETVMDRQKPDEIRRYLATRERRGALVPLWMVDALAKLEPPKAELKLQFLDYDTRRKPKTKHFCIKCQCDLKPDEPYRVVHLYEGPFIVHPKGTQPKSSVAAYPVGMGCAKVIGMQWTRPPETQTPTQT